MRRTLAAPLIAALALGSLPAAATPDLTPYGREDNALGTMRWLPRNANEKAPTNQFRLVVVYDTSITETGAPMPLKVRGAFGVKIFTTSANLRMKNHASSVGDLKTLTGQANLGPVDEVFAGVYGDVRDGTCSKLETGGFSQAYSTPRSFFHPGTEPYAPVSAPGTCEVVDASDAVLDQDGNVTGYQTTVTNHVPGFWIDVDWPTVNANVLGTGRSAAEVWYGGAYDSTGDPGPFPNGVDTTGASKSLGGPGDYQTLSFTANPGAIGDPCDGIPDQPAVGALAGSWQEIKVQVPDTATKVTFMLFPKGDWDLTVYNPDGLKRTSGGWTTLSETVIAPASGTANFPSLVAGEYRMLACNYSGEQTILGGVMIE
ncbi:MAG TPA: hypothetical protein VGB28_05645 [Actinomycetota bacterium]|jgi:hypothetical protein